MCIDMFQQRKVFVDGPNILRARERNPSSLKTKAAACLPRCPKCRHLESLQLMVEK
jgi:hypothetical protein